MKFSIEFKTKELQKFWADSKAESKPMVQYNSVCSYSGLDIVQFKACLKDMLDPPNEPLTLEEVIADFGPRVKDSTAKKIQKYYNFRNSLHKKVLEDAKAVIDKYYDEGPLSVGLGECISELCYDIPADCNSFADDDDCYKPQQQSATVTVRIAP